MALITYRSAPQQEVHLRLDRWMISVVVATAVALVACGGNPTPPPKTFSPTPDPVTRLFAFEASHVLETAAVTLRRIGFDVAEPGPDATRVYSKPVRIQTTWRGAPVADRIVCGVGSAIGSDPMRLRTLANTIPIDLSLGFEIEPRQGATAMKLLFHGEGHRTSAPYFSQPTMLCSVTIDFVDELFAAVAADLASS